MCRDRDRRGGMVRPLHGSLATSRDTRLAYARSCVGCRGARGAVRTRVLRGRRPRTTWRCSAPTTARQRRGRTSALAARAPARSAAVRVGEPLPPDRRLGVAAHRRRDRHRRHAVRRRQRRARCSLGRATRSTCCCIPVVDGAVVRARRDRPRERPRGARRARGRGSSRRSPTCASSVDDWQPMRDRALDARRGAAPRRRRSASTPTRPTEAATFLEWLVDDHFTFVGVCDDARRRRRSAWSARRVPSGLPGVGLRTARAHAHEGRANGRPCTGRCRSTSWA